ncbi:MAG TPA: CHAD domain-containing protein [Acidimicrobiia bacterium]
MAAPIESSTRGSGGEVVPLPIEGLTSGIEPVWVTVEEGRAPTRTARPVVPLRGHGGPVGPDVSIGAGEPLAVALQRICVGQLDRTLVALGQGADLDDGIHTARKAMKRTRAILRLCRYEIGDRVFRVENVVLRDAARRISPVRDAAVRLETLAIIVAPHEEQLVPEAFAFLRTELARRHREQLESLDQTGSVPEVTAMVEAARSRYAGWPTDTSDGRVPGRAVISDAFDAVEPGLRRTYRRGRRAMASARTSPESFHEWRKSAKYLRYQMETLEPVWPSVLGGLARTADNLSETLGTEHDLAVLSELVTDQQNLSPRRGERKLLLSLIGHKQQSLREEAWVLGTRVYAESPAGFTARIGSYWNAWRPPILSNS